MSSNENMAEFGVRVSNLRLVEVTDTGVMISLDVAWDRSWRGVPRWGGGKNWDAAWIFLKFSFVNCKTIPSTSAIEDALRGSSVSDLAEALELALAGIPDGLTSFLSLPRGGSMVTVVKDQHWRMVHRADGRAGFEEHIDILRTKLADGTAGFTLMRQGTWYHAKIQAVAGLPPPEGATIEDTKDRAGVFIYRSEENQGEGPVHFQGVILSCELGALDLKKVSTTLKLWPMGIEMVYVPEGPFYLGDPWPEAEGAPQNCFYDSMKLANDSAAQGDAGCAYQVTDAPIAMGNDGDPAGYSELLWYDNDDDAGGAGDQYKGLLPAAFPTGYQAFYLMKRQITQGQYADFINTLVGGQTGGYAQAVRFPYEGQGTYRNSLGIGEMSNYTRIALQPNRPCNYLAWADGIAYAAWAGLRPMTELEYEKACRGPCTPVHGEYAWGSTKLIAALTILGYGPNEISTGNTNLNNTSTMLRGDGGGLGPMIDESFAAYGHPRVNTMYGSVFVFKGGGDCGWKSDDLLTKRDATGHSFYGIASLTGNLWDLCVTVGTAEGRSFSGREGLGRLNKYGEAETELLGWPGSLGKGCSFRGGSWYTPVGRGPVAARPYGSGAPGFFFRSHDVGFRCARTAGVSPGSPASSGA